MIYPKPSPIGGTLIRKVLAQFKCASGELKLPITRPVLIAVSGGVDSMVLGHILARYGRRVIAPELITFLHLDHGWRKESGGIEKSAVKRLANELGVHFISKKLTPPAKSLLSRNWEEDARLKRTELFNALAGGDEGRNGDESKGVGKSQDKKWTYVMTGHHQDDLAETLLFRFLRGEFLEQQKGILFQDPPLLRPFLKVSKEEIRAYAKAENVPFYEDPTNQDTEQFRALCRLKLMPLLKSHFPGVSKTLASYSERLEGKKGKPQNNSEPPLDNSIRVAIESIVGHPLNRAQRTALFERVSQLKVGGRLSLPQGLEIKRLKNGFFIELID